MNTEKLNKKQIKYKTLKIKIQNKMKKIFTQIALMK